MNAVLVRNRADCVCFGIALHDIFDFRLPIADFVINTSRHTASNGKSAFGNWKFIPVPSPRGGSRSSSSSTAARVPSSLPRSLLAASLGLRQTGLPWHRGCAEKARPVGADEISGPIGCPVVCAVVLCLRPSALQSLLPTPPPGRLWEQ